MIIWGLKDENLLFLFSVENIFFPDNNLASLLLSFRKRNFNTGLWFSDALSIWQSPYITMATTSRCTECHDTTNSASGVEFASTYGSTTDSRLTNDSAFPWELTRDFWREQDQFCTFVAQCEMFMASRLLEFPIDHTKVTWCWACWRKQQPNRRYCSLRGTVQCRTTIKISSILKRHFRDSTQRITES